MHFSFIVIIFIFVGIFLFPIFTLGCVLFAAGHPILGTIAIVISLLKAFSETK